MTVGEVLLENSQNAVVMRLGGDEFVFYMFGADKEEATRRIEEVFQGFEKCKAKSPYLYCSSLSAGLCLTTTSDTYTDVLARADKALYYVKQRGKRSYYFYTQSLNETKRNSAEDLNLLIAGLKEDGAYSGSLTVEYREFVRVYDYIRHLTERYQYDMELVMITLQPRDTGKLYIDERERAMTCMEKTIQASLRAVDVCTRFSSEQFLVILMDARRKDINRITGRIFDNFKKVYDGKDMLLDFDVAELPK